VCVCVCVCVYRNILRSAEFCISGKRYKRVNT